MKQTAGVKLIDELIRLTDRSEQDDMTGPYLLGWQDAIARIYLLIDEYQSDIYAEARER
jgi:hypothetical protein